MSDPVSAPTSFWEWLFGGIWIVVSVLIGLLYKKSEDRVDKLEKDMATKADVTALIAQQAEFEQNRLEMRQDIVGIHQKIDAASRDLHNQISNNQSTILSAIASVKK